MFFPGELFSGAFGVVGGVVGGIAGGTAEGAVTAASTAFAVVGIAGMLSGKVAFATDTAGG